MIYVIGVQCRCENENQTAAYSVAAKSMESLF